MSKHDDARERNRRLFNNHSLIFRYVGDVPKIKHYYDDIKKYITECEATEKKLKRLQKKEVVMKPIVDNGHPYCPICKTDLCHGCGLMGKYTDYYCIRCGQKLDWSEEEIK